MRRTLVAITAALTLAAARALAMHRSPEATTTPKPRPAEPTPIRTSRPCQALGGGWAPPGFEQLNRLLACGHSYPMMAWP